jgi:hypothetical protein
MIVIINDTEDFIKISMECNDFTRQLDKTTTALRDLFSMLSAASARVTS